MWRQNFQQQQQQQQEPAKCLDLTREAFRHDSFQTYAIVSSLVMGSSLCLFSMINWSRQSLSSGSISNDDDRSSRLDSNSSLSEQQRRDDDNLGCDNCNGGTRREQRRQSSSIVAASQTSSLPIAKFAFAILGCTSVMMGAHATTIFTFVNVYAKTALGLGSHYDKEYVMFLDQTLVYRQRGFHTLWISLLTFMLAFVLWTYIQLSSWVVANDTITTTHGGSTSRQCITITGVVVAMLIFTAQDFRQITNLASNLIFDKM